jgi:hypothetical protein
MNAPSRRTARRKAEALEAEALKANKPEDQ